MALNVDVIEITQPASVINRQQTYNLAAGFDPKAIIIFGTPQTADGNIVSWAYGLGFGTYRGGTVQQRWTTMRSLDGATAADLAAGQGNDAVFKMVTQSAGSATVDLEIDLLSMTNSGTPNVVLDWANFHTTAGIKLFMMVLGGSDITDALAGVSSTYPTTGTTFDVTVASGFGKPDLVILNSMVDTDLAPGNTLNPQFTLGIGWPGVAGVSQSFVQTDGNTASIVAARQDTNKIWSKIAPGGASMEAIGRLDTTQANWPTDGFRMIFDANPSFGAVVPFLALKGSFSKALISGQSPNSGTPPVDQDHPLGSGLTPRGAFHFNWNLTSAAQGSIRTTDGNLLSMGIGAYDGATEATAGFSEDDGAGTMDSNQWRSAAKVFQWRTIAGAMAAEADGSFSSDNYRLSFTTIGVGSAGTYLGVVLGDAAGGGGTGYTENPADSVTPSDATALDQGKAAADSVATSDALAKDVGKALADTLGLADNAATAKDIPYGPSDTLSLSDNATAEITKTVNVDDSVSLSETFSADRGLSVADVLGLADNAAVAEDNQLAPADTVGLADSASTAKTIPQTPSDSLGVSDNTSIAKTIPLAVNDSVTPSDSLERVVDLQRTADDSVGLSDDLARTVDIQRSFDDSVGLADEATPDITAGATDHTVNADDSIGLADNFSWAEDNVVGAADSVSLSDDFSLAVDHVLVFDDSITIGDEVFKTYTILFEDSLTLDDNASLVVPQNWTVTPEDSVVVTDLATPFNYSPPAAGGTRAAIVIGRF